jgi:hypothetical protein
VEGIQGGGDLHVAPALEHPLIERARGVLGQFAELNAGLGFEPGGGLASDENGQDEGGREAEAGQG